jgi:3-dehydroquinate dehydratase / shikimate dehydrogenase
VTLEATRTPERTLEHLDPEPAVVLSLLESDAPATERRLEQVPAGCTLVEIRADRLRADEVAGLVRLAPRPAIVTARAVRDGGRFDGSEEERRRVLEAALAGGAIAVDVEWDGPLREFAFGELGARVVLSHHGAPCHPELLRALHSEMAGTRAARLKIVPRCARPADGLVLQQFLAEARRASPPLAAFAEGAPGGWTRIFAPSWGSWGTYAPPAWGAKTAEGQIPVNDLLELYRVRDLRPETRRFALVGFPVRGSPSPAMHAAGYRAEALDALYFPLESESLAAVEPILDPEAGVGLEGFAATVPVKEEAAAGCRLEDEIARSARAVNTVLLRPGARLGYNTDGPGAMTLLRRHLDPSGRKALVVGAGGAGRGVAVSLRLAGADVLLVNRTRARAERAAEELGVRAGDLDRILHEDWDILVQATPLGRDGEEVVPARRLVGRVVIDVAYGVEPTPLVRDARRRGLAVVDGFELLTAQAALQFERLTGHPVAESILARAGRAWLERRRGAA